MKTKEVGTILLTVALAPFFTPNAKAESSPSIRIPYSAQIPSQIRRFTKSTKQTRFYGSAVVNSQKLALHFYDMSALKKVDAYRATQNSKLDLFIERHRQNGSAFERIQSIPVHYQSWTVGRVIIQADVIWLDSALQTKPIIKLHLENRLSSGGITGSDMLFIFPAGINNAAVTQNFDFYYHEGPTGASSNNFDSASKNGLLSIFQRYIGNTGIDYTGWKWDGSKFTKAQELHIDPDFPKRYQWNGEELTEK